MSQERMELARRVFDDRDPGEIDQAELRSPFHADVEFLPQRAGTEGAYSGVAGIEKFVADAHEIFEKFDVVAVYRPFGTEQEALEAAGLQE
jgi:hypothetical protein